MSAAGLSRLRCLSAAALAPRPGDSATRGPYRSPPTLAPRRPYAPFPSNAIGYTFCVNECVGDH